MDDLSADLGVSQEQLLASALRVQAEQSRARRWRLVLWSGLLSASAVALAGYFALPELLRPSKLELERECGALERNRQESCLADLAVRIEDPTVCERLPAPGGRGSCLRDYFEVTRDPAACDLLAGEEQVGCLLTSAKALGDGTLCTRIAETNGRYKCILEFLSTGGSAQINQDLELCNTLPKRLMGPCTYPIYKRIEHPRDCASLPTPGSRLGCISTLPGMVGDPETFCADFSADRVECLRALDYGADKLSLETRIELCREDATKQAACLSSLAFDKLESRACPPEDSKCRARIALLTLRVEDCAGIDDDEFRATCLTVVGLETARSEDCARVPERFAELRRICETGDFRYRYDLMGRLLR